MFNFNLMNKALTDANISDSQFRTLYLIANNCSMKGTNSIEMYNAFLMNCLHYSESTVKRCTKGLEDNGYISISRATKKRTPNVISLLEVCNESKVESEIECKNDTLYKNFHNRNKIQCNDVQDNITKDNGIDYDIYCEMELAKKNAERQKATDIQSNLVTSNDVDHPKEIDWNVWRAKFENAKKHLLNAKNKDEFEAYQMAITECLNYAEQHMRKEKYEKVISVYDKWHAASEPYFYNSKQTKQGALQTKKTPKQEFEYNQWDYFLCEMQYDPVTRQETAKKMKQYLIDCGKDTCQLQKDLKEQYGIAV